jgi:hypothetical protein
MPVWLEVGVVPGRARSAFLQLETETFTMRSTPFVKDAGGAAQQCWDESD